MLALAYKKVTAKDFDLSPTQIANKGIVSYVDNHSEDVLFMLLCYVKPYFALFYVTTCYIMSC